MLATILLVVAGIRVIVWLLTPLVPLLIGLLVVFTVVQLVRWYRGRW